MAWSRNFRKNAEPSNDKWILYPKTCLSDCNPENSQLQTWWRWFLLTHFSLMVWIKNRKDPLLSCSSSRQIWELTKEPKCLVALDNYLSSHERSLFANWGKFWIPWCRSAKNMKSHISSKILKPRILKVQFAQELLDMYARAWETLRLINYGT